MAIPINQGVKFHSWQSEWSQVECVLGGKVHIFPYHPSTGQIFNSDSEFLVRLKCAALTGLTPLVCLARSVAWAAKTAFLCLAEIYQRLEGLPFSVERIRAIQDTGVDSLRALTYGFVLTGHALRGVYDPFRARLEYGRLERELNRHPQGPRRNKFYLALCFQRLVDHCQGNLTVQKKLARHVNFVHEVSQACEEMFTQFNCTRMEKVFKDQTTLLDS